MANPLTKHDLTKKIIALYGDGMNGKEIAKELNVAPGTVYSRLRKYKNLIKKKGLEQEGEVKDIIDQLNSNVPSQIAGKIFSIMNDQENLEMEFIEKGFDPLNRMLGMILDKVIKIKELEQNKQIAEQRDEQNDGFFEAMQEAIVQLAKKGNLENLIDDNSFIEDDDEHQVN